MTETTNSTPNPEIPNPRRNWLRRTALGAMIAAVGVGAGWQALAGGEHGGRHHRGFLSASMDPADMEKRLDRMLKHMYVEIDATDAQKAKLDPIVKSAVKDLMPVRAKLREARKQAMGLLTQDSIDRAAIEALRVQQVALAGDATRRFTQALTDVAEVLTPAQRKELATRMEKRRHRGHHG